MNTGLRRNSTPLPIERPCRPDGLVEADIESGRDRIGIGAWRSPTGIGFNFPVSIMAWELPEQAAR